MTHDTFKDELQLFKSLFKSREDVFAIRWEKGSKSGYMPAYYFDPYMYRAHKISGGTFQNYHDKRYLPLTDIEIEKHLNGVQLIGIYPLLEITLPGLSQLILIRTVGLKKVKHLLLPVTKKEFLLI